MTYERPLMTPADARDYITSMTTRPYTQTHPYRPEDIYDLGQMMLRDLLCSNADRNENPIDLDYYMKEFKDHTSFLRYIPVIREHLHFAYISLLADHYSIDFISRLCLDNSVCPVHHDDYAACFDDDLDECRTIRQYFPNHDT